MLGTRGIGLSHIYLDNKIEGFSNVAAGMVIRAIGHGLKIGYVDCSSGSTKFVNFLENLCLSYSFVKKFGSFHIEVFRFNSKNNRINKSILPLVEFQTVSEDIFWDSILNFDLIIFDNFDLEKINQYKIKNILENRGINSEIVFTTKDPKVFENLKSQFDFAVKYTYKKNPLLSTSRNIINLNGTSRGKSSYSYGYLLRKFFEKNDVKLIYFDREGNFYGERLFFQALKKWMQENSFYGSLDFVVTGAKRFEGRKFRQGINDEDIREAKEGLMLLKTSIKKQTPVLAEDLLNVVNNGTLREEEVEEAISEVNRELIITGKESTKKISSLSNIEITVEDLNQGLRNNKETRKGIDF